VKIKERIRPVIIHTLVDTSGMMDRLETGVMDCISFTILRVTLENAKKLHW
jgi:hypothetical protein